MDRDDQRKNFTKDLESQDTYDTRQAKQRASIKWLLSKAYNNRVPENLREPFYKDHEEQEHVKPQIVHNLANCELYCLAFANIYSDPNYHNLNHGGILQTLARKGVAIPDYGEGPLTETILIKTTPIKLVAHIAMIEAIMELYTNEVVSPDRVVAAVHRFTHGAISPPMPVSAEEGLLVWVNQAQAALAQRISLEGDAEPPRFQPVRDVKGLSDGAGLAALVSFYCPEELPWQEIKAPALPTVSDSVHNLCLVHEFSHHSLPSTVCHMMPEDVTYLRGNMRMNLLALLADLFNVLEIHPVKCVRFPGREPSTERNSQGVAHKRSLPQPVTGIPDLRSHLSSHSSFTVSRTTGSAGIRKSHSSPYSESCFAGSPDSLDTRQFDDRDPYAMRRGEEFVVHRGRAVPTLSSMLAEDPLMPARLRPNKERGNHDSKGEERGEAGRAAGKPSHCDESKRMSYAGRRSRRNSLTEDSQLTVENFGGSQENLHFLGRNPDKDPAILLSAAAATAIRTSAQEARSSGVELIFAGGDGGSDSPLQRRKSPSPAPGIAHPTPNVPIRSSQQDARSNAIDRIFADNGYGIEKRDAEKPSKEKSRDRELVKESPNSNMVSLNHVLQHSKQSDYPDGDISGISPLRLDESVNERNGLSEKMTSFAASPNTTTWQMQQKSSPVSAGLQQVPNIPDESLSNILNVRLKLEEKRRLIENEKKRLELATNRERQKLGKAAFLQAVTKKQVKPVSCEMVQVVDESPDFENGDKDVRDIPLDRTWMDGALTEELRSPEIENLNITQFQKSMAQMDSGLSEIDSEMQKLGLHDQFKDFASQQQKKIANLVNQQQKLQTFAMQMSANQSIQNNKQPNFGNQTYTTFGNSSPPIKPLSLSQLHHKNTSQSHNQSSGQQFFLHEQPRRTTWREQSDQVPVWQEDTQPGFNLHEPRVNGGPTPSPRSAVASPLHSRPTPPPKPAVPPRQTQPRPVPTAIPSVDDMEPQSICFIGDAEDEQALSRINISSGSRTYRIPSPTRPHAKNPFLQRAPPESEPEKGFYISFDDEAPPKRPKPPLRGKRSSPKKDRFATQVIETPFEERDEICTRDTVPEPSLSARSRAGQSSLPFSPENTTRTQSLNYSPDAPVRTSKAPVTYSPDTVTRPSAAAVSNHQQEPMSPGVGLVIGNEPDPNAVDEMERKKEKILLLSLQRRQQQEELKSKKEIDAQMRREMEKIKEEDRTRKKEEEKMRRAQILEQYKLKKAIEEAEREGNTIDKAELLKLAAPKMRSKPTTTPRPRPKTIHVESGSSGVMLAPSRGQRGSSNNLADRPHDNSMFNRPLRRDQYRGSQDSLAGTMSARGRPRESPCDDDRGTSPSRGGAGVSNLGRRGSYKTSRDTSEPPRNRSRSKYSTYQPVLRNRKSNSLMNLSGSSTDQDSLAYRYGDTDSGLGRATPPRRAPSPGFNRHLTSPSGPGSLPPGLITKRRGFDDGASDVSSNASSMMDYTGPRLYKQPATKSNRGIMLNAVEYCVFPGVVNKDAKRRVLEEISRSEAKHFLILFRDAGCQFRALYSYCPDTEDVLKLYGTGPKQVNERMFDRFFKYNSGGKCFSQIHTKHLTVTIDAFTIHNSLWQGKKVNLPSKKDMALVI